MFGLAAFQSATIWSVASTVAGCHTYVAKRRSTASVGPEGLVAAGDPAGEAASVGAPVVGEAAPVGAPVVGEAAGEAPPPAHAVATRSAANATPSNRLGLIAVLLWCWEPLWDGRCADFSP